MNEGVLNISVFNSQKGFRPPALASVELDQHKH